MLLLQTDNAEIVHDTNALLTKISCTDRNIFTAVERMTEKFRGIAVNAIRTRSPTRKTLDTRLNIEQPRIDVVTRVRSSPFDPER